MNPEPQERSRMVIEQFLAVVTLFWRKKLFTSANSFSMPKVISFMRDDHAAQSIIE